MGDKIIALENKAYRVISVGIPVAVLEKLRGFTVDDKIAVCVAVKSTDDVEHRRFSAARRSENRYKLVFAEAETHTVKCGNRRIARLICLDDIF